MKRKIIGTKPPILPLSPRQEGVALSPAEERVKDAIEVTKKSGQHPLRIAEELKQFCSEL